MSCFGKWLVDNEQNDKKLITKTNPQLLPFLLLSQIIYNIWLHITVYKKCSTKINNIMIKNKTFFNP